MTIQIKKHRGRKFGYIVSEDEKNKIRNSYYHTHQKGKKMMVQKGQTLEEVYGKNKSDDMKIRISNTMRERGISPKIKFKKGYKMSNEIKKKISKYHKGRKLSREHIEAVKRNHKSWIRGIGHSEETCKKMSKTRKEKMAAGLIKLSPDAGWNKERRSHFVLPKKDTSIEIKIQNFLKQLNINFFTHQYMNIEHSYQCDILIPSMNLIVECDGMYWHKYPIGTEIDKIRANELIKKGFKVLRFWENEIRVMELSDLKLKLEDYK